MSSLQYMKIILKIILKKSKKDLTNQDSYAKIAISYGTKPVSDKFGPLAQLVRATGS